MSLKDVADVATTAGIILGIPLTLYGIDAWRREAQWKRRAELCEEVLALCYEAQEIISYIRSPGGFGGEGETRKPDEGEPDEVRRKKNTAWVPIERHNNHLEKLSRLWALSYRFRAQFGIEKTRPIDALRNVIGEVRSAAFILSNLWTTLRWNFMTPAQFESNTALVKKYEAKIWEGLGAGEPVNGVPLPDELQLKVNQAVHEVEETCREILDAQHTLFGMLNARWILWKAR